MLTQCPNYHNHQMRTNLDQIDRVYGGDLLELPKYVGLVGWCILPRFKEERIVAPIRRLEGEEDGDRVDRECLAADHD